MTDEISATTSLLKIADEASKNSVMPVGTKLYLFGSAADENVGSPNDVDVLVIYADGHVGEAHALSDAIRASGESHIFDVLALSASEDEELRFVQSERVIQIWPPSP